MKKAGLYDRLFSWQEPSDKPTVWFHVKSATRNEGGGKLTLLAYDADETYCLGIWYASDGQGLEGIQESPDYHKTAQYLWDGNIVKELLRQAACNPTVKRTCLAGISGNAVSHSGMFDEVVYLDEDAPTLFERINSRDETMFPWRLSPADLEQFERTVDYFRSEMSAIGAAAIGPGLTIPQAADAIIELSNLPVQSGCK